MQRPIYKLKGQWKYKHHAPQDQIAIHNIEDESHECRMIRAMAQNKNSGKCFKKRNREIPTRRFPRRARPISRESYRVAAASRGAYRKSGSYPPADSRFPGRSPVNSPANSGRIPWKLITRDGEITGFGALPQFRYDPLLTVHRVMNDMYG